MSLNSAYVNGERRKSQKCVHRRVCRWAAEEEERSREERKERFLRLYQPGCL